MKFDRFTQKVEEIRRSLVTESVNDLFNMIMSIKSFDDFKNNKEAVEEFKKMDEEAAKDLVNKLADESARNQDNKTLEQICLYLKGIYEKRSI